MVDLGAQYTDKKIRELDRRIQEIYKEAERDIERKMKDFNERYKFKEARYQRMVDDGKMQQKDFDSWKKGQVFQGKAWQAKKDQITEVLYNSNKIASQLINEERQNVFGANFNYASYSMETGANVNFGFGVYDRETVVNLLKNQPNLLPNYVPKKGIDKAWNSKIITRQVTQGIIQGEKLDQIAERLAKATSSQDMNSMKTHARTLMTGAQNVGRLQSYKQASDLGIDMEKEWMATLDGHTRDSHADVDGERQPIERKFSNDCMYPGDPGGPPAEVYNCRCTMVSNIKKYPAKYQRYDNINGHPIPNMTYSAWKRAKHVRPVSASKFVWNRNYTGAPNRNYGKADTSDALQEILSGKSNSLDGYIDARGNLTPEREALHQQIIDNYLAEKVPERERATMVMMGGGPASGKSSVIKSGLYTLPDSSITIDPDDIKQFLPGYLERSKIDNTAASFYHEESSLLAKRLASTCFNENFNVVYDGTGDGSIGSVMKKINGAKEHEYQVNAMYVTVDIQEALKRNKSRYDHAVAMGGAPRLVPDSYVIDCHRKVTRISMEVGDQFDSISLYDNNGTSADIKLIAIGGNGTKLHAVKGEEKAFESYLNKAK